MENAQDSKMEKVSTKINASNVLNPTNKEGGVQMETKYNINEALAKSPLRKGRYQYMRDYLQRKGEYHFSNTSHQRFHGMTQEQSEQALDDVVLKGYARVKTFYLDGALIIESLEKEEEPNKP